MDHGLVAPEALPEPGQGFLEAAQIKQARAAGPVRPFIRFAQIIRAGPQKLPGDEIIGLHREPGAVLLAVLAAVDDALRIFLVVVGVASFLVVIAVGIEQLCESNGVGHGHGGQRGGDRAGGVEGFDGGNQRLGAGDQLLGGRMAGVVIAAEHGIGEGVVGVVHFVANAPEDDAGMIAVADDEVLDVGDGPLGEDFAVAVMAGRAVVAAGDPLVLAGREFVKRLVHHEEAELVAEIEQGGVGRIVAGADGIGADFLEREQAAQEHFVRHGRADGAGIVMQADTLDLHIFPIEKKSLVRVEMKFANAKSVGDLIHNCRAVGCDFGDGVVEVWGMSGFQGCGLGMDGSSVSSRLSVAVPDQRWNCLNFAMS